MIKRNFFSILFVLSIAVCIYLTYNNLRMNLKYRNETSRLENLLNSSVRKYNNLINREKIQFISNSTNINNIIPLRDIKSTKVIIRIKEDDCTSCIDTFYKDIPIISKLIGKDNLIIIGDYQIKRHLYIDLANNNLKELKLLNINTEITDSYIEKHTNHSYYFVSNNNDINMIFIPLANDRRRTLNFFQIVKNIHFDD